MIAEAEKFPYLEREEVVLGKTPFDVSTKGVKKHRKWIRPFHSHGILITYQKSMVEGRELRAAMVWHQGRQTYFGPKRDAEVWWKRCRRW